ncbi:MAG TPA: DNA internalization-related competence protein ComEC/Rec2, partial [Rhodothermales bacterium]|nr:DNA internalization-related competence protein ComEC/Rec2 [Rhodothermales bacterium]
VAGLVLLHPVFMHPFEACGRPVRRAVAALSISLAATLATAPILFYTFGYVSLAGLFLNLAAVPLTSILMVAGLVTVLTAAVTATAAGSFGAACGALAHVLLLLASAGNDYLSWAAVQGQFLTGWEAAAMAVLLWAIAVVRIPRLRWRLACSTLVLVAAGAWSGVLSGEAAPRLQAIFFDVGQGDAALILTPNRHALLVDTGPGGDWGDAGARTILPHLRRYGIRNLDAVVITHPHLDHIGGLASILRNVPVHRVIHSVENHVQEIPAFDLIDSLHIASRRVHTGDTLCIDPALRIGVLSPDRNAAMGTDVNEASVVLRVMYGRTTFLLLGDADADAEVAMAARYGALLRSDVVKVGHHGSSTSSSPVFVARVRPDSAAPAFAVVSVAQHNRYGLPDSTVLARWRRSGATVLTTASEGAIWLESDGRRVWRKHWR